MNPNSKIKTFFNTKGCTLVTTQYMENYNWYAGEDAEPHWKYKGGSDYVVPTEDLSYFLEQSGEIYDNNHSRQYVLGMHVLQEDLTFEIPDYIEADEEQDYLNCMGPTIWVRSEAVV